MSRYTKGKKEHALVLMDPPQDVLVAEVSKDAKIGEPTLYGWCNQARPMRRTTLDDGSRAESWRMQDKFGVVVETIGLADAGLADLGLAHSLRCQGLDDHAHLKIDSAPRNLSLSGACSLAIRQFATLSAVLAQGSAGFLHTMLAEERRRSRGLDKERRREKKALAEMEVLLVLSREFETLWNKDENA